MPNRETTNQNILYFNNLDDDIIILFGPNNQQKSNQSNSENLSYLINECIINYDERTTEIEKEISREKSRQFINGIAIRVVTPFNMLPNLESV